MRKVLIVTRGLLSGLPASLLDRRSIRVRTADDMDDAAQIAAAWRPDLVIVSASAVPVLRKAAPEARYLVIGELEDRSVADAQLPENSDVALVLARTGELLDLPTRGSPRLPTDFMAKVSRSDGNVVLAHIVLLSDTGMLVECEDVLAVDEELVIQFHLPGQDEPVAPRGRVVSADAVQRRFAIAFGKGDSRHRDAILVYVDLQTAARAEVTRHLPDE
jgi:hypothetical protein